MKASENPGKQVVERFQIEQFKPVSERESRFPVQHGITFDIDGVKDLQAVLASYLATLAPEPDTVRAKKTLFALDGADIMVNHFVHQGLFEELLIPLEPLDILWALCHPYMPASISPKFGRGGVQGEFTHFQLIIEVGCIVLFVLLFQ